MILIYDFKIPVKRKNPETTELEKEEEIFSDYFLKYFNEKSSEGINYIKNFRHKIKIIKKSLDFRQREPKNVYKVLIKFDFSGKNEDDIINILAGIGIKARKASYEEEKLFYEENSLYFENGRQNENAEKTDNNKTKKNNCNKSAVLITGMGPAGIFAAVYLLKHGIRPVLIEKGKCIEERIKDVNALLNKGKFNKKSNVVFGEGGAGTFSDGKLTTRKDDAAVSFVLNFLVKMGADKKILVEHKPHVGSDILIDVLRNIRNYLTDGGAQIFFGEELKDFDTDDNNRIVSAVTDKRIISADFLILAAGSNSIDTYEMLKRKNVFLENKPFAVGFRIEHKRNFIDSLFFKGGRNKNDLKFSGVYYNVSSKEYGGYSFCMCPGGVVINSSSGENILSVNGMSYSSRDLENSNSAIVAAVRADMVALLDKKEYSLNGGFLSFRKDLEIKAFNAGGGGYGAPYQYTPEYIADVIGKTEKETGFNVNSALKSDSGIKRGNLIPEPSYKPSVKYFNLFELVPDFINRSIAGSLIEFDKKYKGFVPNSVLTAIETGTSSAVRIKRGKDYESLSVKGLYPCGEGSGYSGGIITSAIDGIKCAAAVANKIF
ncbi:MAG: NAD(P)/FAD-dependent oxidoreductase [Deltaproteobacteria bacterium]|nr:NAD(P)/FAD-dependent oxidoreductase [Deltaproteobacteria bacterium]